MATSNINYLSNLSKDDLLSVVIHSLRLLNEEVGLDAIPDDKWDEIVANDTIPDVISDVFKYIEHHVIPFLEDNREELIK